jgi:phage terminase small subunit
VRRAKDFTDLARTLRLTKAQRCFAEALAVDPDKNQTHAAIAAGVNHRRARIQGSRWVTSGKVQDYLAALSEASEQMVEERTGKAVAQLSEVLETLSAQMRVRPLDYLVAVEKDGKPTGKYLMDVEKVRQAGPVVAAVSRDETGDIKITFADRQKAALALLNHYQTTAGVDQHARHQPLMVNFFDLPEDMLRQLQRVQLYLSARAQERAAEAPLDIPPKPVVARQDRHPARRALIVAERLSDVPDRVHR